MTWEKSKAPDKAPKCAVSVSYDRRLNFNAAARRTFGLKDYTHVMFYLDKPSLKVGIELLKVKEEGCTKLTLGKKYQTTTFGWIIDLWELGIPLQALPLEKDPETGYLVFQIPERFVGIKDSPGVLKGREYEPPVDVSAGEVGASYARRIENKKGFDRG